tara:strand:+ start:15476 stop:16264 length:789 start_codon:yes stop_codon:yes gene_type:complete
MSFQTMADALKVKTGNVYSKTILLCLANYANEENTCFPSVARISEETEISRRSVQRWLRDLEEKGFITTEKRYDNNKQTSSIYHINTDAFRGVTVTGGGRLSDLGGASDRRTEPITEPVTIIEEENILKEISPDKDFKKYLELSGDGTIITAKELYNDMAEKAGLSKAQVLSPTRKAKIKARLKECDGIEGWKAALDLVASSPFLTGQNKQGWKADLDFILQPAKFIRILEGSYSGGGKNSLMQAIDDLDKQINGTANGNLF